MQSLRQRYSVNAEIVAMGDNVNDIEMLKTADRAIAVENAVPQLHQLAHEVIPHHADDSVIQFLEREAPKIGA